MYNTLNDFYNIRNCSVKGIKTRMLYINGSLKNIFQRCSEKVGGECKTVGILLLIRGIHISFTDDNDCSRT